MKYLSDVLIHRAACGLAAAVVFAAVPAQAQPVTIMQISGYNMEPYPTTLGPSGNNDPMGIEDAMEALGTAGVSGMVYASLGESEARYYRTGQWTKPASSMAAAFTTRCSTTARSTRLPAPTMSI